MDTTKLWKNQFKKIKLTLKWVDILAPSFLKWKVQLSPLYTLDSQVSKAVGNLKGGERKKQCVFLFVKYTVYTALGEKQSQRCDAHLWRRFPWGLMVITQMPELLGQSLPTRQWGWGLCGGSLVTKETVTVTFFKCSMGPWIWVREQEDLNTPPTQWFSVVNEV